jgi:glycosyltransferase involved in cell wall biosynthesis
MPGRRSVLFVARTRYRLPLDAATARKWDALAERLGVRVVATAADGSAVDDGRFRLLGTASGVAYYPAVALAVARELRSFRPDAILAQSPYEGAAALLGRRLAGRPVPVVVEVHGDWRTAARLYGSPLRRVLELPSRLAARYALRRADAVRPVGPFTAGLVRELGVEPAASFTTYFDLSAFTARPPLPLPERPAALFVGVLEAYKNVDGLAAAWRLASPRVPAATLHVVGKGSRSGVAEALVRDGARWDAELSSGEVAAAMDAAWVLVLPSRSEGMGRVLVEAFCRGRGVVGTRAGSIPNLVEDGVSGILVDPEDPVRLAEALVRALSDRALAERLGEAARAAAAPWLQTPEEYARRMKELVS